MPRRYRRRKKRPAYYDDYDDFDSRSRRRRGGFFGGIKRFLRTAATVFLTALGAIVFFLIVLLIVFNFALFIQILYYALFIGTGLAILGVLYVIVRITTAISHRISAASAARSKAKLEKERARIEREHVQQVRVQVRLQEAKLHRDDFAFYQKYPDHSYESPRRTRVMHADPYNDLAQGSRNIQSPRQTRVLREAEQHPPVRVLSQSSTPATAPTSPPTPRVQGDVPHVTQLIGSAIVVGQRDMLYGFEIINGSLFAVRGDYPGTAIIAGKSGSGKTRRVIIMLLQAILAGQKITICDSHSYKPDGLINVLAPFAPWLRFARSDDEIIAAAYEHIEECESRLTAEGSVHGEGLTPRLIVFDEFSALMKSDSISSKDKRAITKCVRESATQYRGVKGAAWIIGQEFTQDALGDTAIRKDAHAILCHQLSDEYAKFLFPRDLRAQRLIQQIARRECIYKDSDNTIRRISTPTVLDEEIPTLVAYLERVCPLQTRPAATRTTTGLHSRPTEPISSSPQQSRQYGAPAFRAQQQHSRQLHRTNLVQSVPSNPSARPTWGEEEEPLPGRRLVTQRDTEDLSARQSPASQPQQRSKPPQNPFDALAEQRNQRRK